MQTARRRFIVAALVGVTCAPNLLMAQFKPIGDLIDDLHAESAKTRIAACRSLTRMGSSAYPATDALSALLDDRRCVAVPASCGDRRCVCDDALAALGAIGPSAAAAVPRIREFLGASDTPRRPALAALASIEGVEVLLPYLNHPTSEGRAAAALALSDAWPMSDQSRPQTSFQVVGGLLSLLSASGRERSAAVSAITVIGPATAPYAPQIVDEIFSHLFNRTDRRVVNALVAMGDCAVDPVRPWLNSEYWVARRTAVAVLGELDPAALDPVGQLPEDPDRAVAILCEYLAEEPRPDNTYLRSEAAKRVGEYGEAGAPAIPSLLELVVGSDDHAAFAAQGSLAAIGKPAVPVLLEVSTWLREETPNLGRPRPGYTSPTVVRTRVIITLGNVGPAAAIALPEILESTRDGNESVRIAAGRALGNLGLGDQIVFDRLVEMVESDPEMAVRRQALAAIGGMAPTYPGVFPYLERIAFADAPIAAYAPYVLRDCGPSAVPYLISIFERGRAEVSARACLAINQLDEIPPAAVESAIGLLESPERDVSRCAGSIVYRCVDSHPEVILDALIGDNKEISGLVENVVVRRGVPTTLRTAGAQRGEQSTALLDDLADRNRKLPITIP